jgi:hypothetical protein
MPQEQDYSVELTANAFVSTTVVIKATSDEDAQEKAKALAQSGDVSWCQQGIDETSVDANAEIHN